MSTRGAISYIETEGGDWQGVYIHRDGYPSGLGARVWREVREQFRGDLQRFITERITAHPGGYADFPGDCYCHGRETLEPDIVTASSHHGHIEWVYVLEERVGTLAVYRKDDQWSPVEVVGGWILAGKFSIWEAEPDWAELERQPLGNHERVNLLLEAW